MKKATQLYRRREAGQMFSLAELTVFCGASADCIVALVDRGIVAPVMTRAKEWVFSPQDVARARRATRLMADPGLNMNAVAMVMDLIDERNALARRLAMIEPAIHS